MRAGLQNTNIDQIMAQLQTRTRQMTRNSAVELGMQSFLATRTMARLGVNAQTTIDVINNALKNQYTAQEMKQVRNNFKSQSKYTSPNQLANQYTQGLAVGKKPDALGSPQASGKKQSGASSGSDNSSGSSNGANGGSGGNSGGSGGGSGGNGSGSGGSGGGSGGNSGGSGGSGGGSSGNSGKE